MQVKCHNKYPSNNNILVNDMNSPRCTEEAIPVTSWNVFGNHWHSV